MAIRGMVGAVYESDAAPISENIALLFDWTLEVQQRKEFTYGPQLHVIPEGWHVKAEAYWAPETMPQGRYFVRLFIGKGDDARTLAGNVELPALKMAEEITEMKITFEGVDQLIQEG
jgi:hypothetical protein